MRTTLIVAILSLLIVNGYSQEQKGTVPESIKKTFASQYPDITKVTWEIKKDGKYEAEYKINKQEISVMYDANGNLLETETDLKQADLPQAIIAVLAKDFAGYKLEEIEKKEIKGEKTYCMEAELGEKEYKLAFDESGKILKQEEEKED